LDIFIDLFFDLKKTNWPKQCIEIKKFRNMKKNYEKSRRQFLKNSSLTALSLGIFPSLFGANPAAENKGEESGNLLELCNETTNDLFGQGPFYTENAPTIQNNQLADMNEAGTKLILSGRVYNLDCSEFIVNTEIDIWHADDDGAYDNTGYNLRGKTTTNGQGFYLFETVKPGLYLNGANYRPSHIHLKITPPGFSTLTTQIYFEGDPNIPSDAAASVTNGIYDATHRIIPLTTNSQGDLEGVWDIVINGDGAPLGTNDIHLDTGMIYQATPNPFQNELIIQYGVFQKSKVSLSVYDLLGRKVATLDEKTLQPEKYELVWQPEDRLPDGHYFIALKVNDLQVHYIKVIRKR